MSVHGSPYHVHPYPSPVRLQHAFQNNAQGSPKMFHPKGLPKSHIDRSYGTPNDSPILGRALCLTPKGSPIPGRVSHLNEKFQDSLTLSSDTEALVAKISAMFPTVTETHIKILLKKYYNREAVVISALQVEKHPITTPGPVSMSPRVGRLQRGALGVYSAIQLKGSSTQGSSHMSTPNGSPLLLRPSSGASSYYGTTRSSEGQPRMHHSPKMKLKYLKSIFPKAEETLILDILANKDNNVQKASEELQLMGFQKKETNINNPPKKPKERDAPPKKVVTIMKTNEEKTQLKHKLQKKYSDIADRVISIALESVDFNEEMAEQILTVVVNEEKNPKSIAIETKTHNTSSTITEKRIEPILKLRTSDDKKYKSHYTSQSIGADPQIRKGPKDSLLLEDYVTWKGPNPDLRSGTVHSDGSDAIDVSTKPPLAQGPDPTLAKGPAGIAKGSFYKKLTKKSTKLCLN